ncbi:MAG: cysteine hydrolase family protein [Acidimicrobiia bacterium]
MTAVTCWSGRSFDFDPATTALLVIDMQRDFLDPDGMSAVGGEAVSELRKVIPAVQRLTTAARTAGVRVIHTREGYASDLSDVSQAKADRSSVGEPGPLGRFLVRGEPGHDFAAGFEPIPGEAVIDKPGFGAFFASDLEALLKAVSVTHLIIAGITTQCCVHSTLREAVDRGFYCLTVADACAAFDADVHDAVLTVIQAENHLFGWIANVDAVVTEIEAVRDPG